MLVVLLLFYDSTAASAHLPDHHDHQHGPTSKLQMHVCLQRVKPCGPSKYDTKGTVLSFHNSPD